MTRNAILVGGGGHALSVGSILEAAGIRILGYTDANPTDLKWEYVGTDGEVIQTEFPDGTYIVTAVGTDTQARMNIYNRYTSSNLRFMTFIHSLAYVDSSAQLGQGCVLYPHTFIGPNVVLGKNVNVSAGTIIEHGSSVGDHSYIAPGVTIAGNVRVGSNCLLGMNSAVMESISVADNTILGASSFLMKSVENASRTYAGVPARHLRE